MGFIHCKLYMIVLSQGNQWVGYDKVESIRRKMEHVRAKGLGGAMIWAIDLDDYRGACGTKWPLLTNMNLILRRKYLELVGKEIFKKCRRHNLLYNLIIINLYIIIKTDREISVDFSLLIHNKHEIK